jgi:cobalt-zinc-cadmium efflux system membrane fusion protein
MNIHTKKMTNKISIMFSIALLVFSCRQSDHSGEHEHPHDDGPAPLAYTLYTDKTELFVEFKPLVVGEFSRFAAHFTKLGENFTALEEGTLTLSLVVNGKGIRTTSEKASSPGIFRLALKPAAQGIGTLIFDIKTKDFTDRITIDSVTVFEDNGIAAKSALVQTSGTPITFLKEQAWKIEFANIEVKPQIFHEVIKVTGEISSRPSDEQVVSARSNGVVNWHEDIVTGSKVETGKKLFVLTSGNLAQGNIESQFREAKVNYEKAKAEYERVQPLLKDKIVSQKDYLEIKNRYEQAEIAFETLNKNYSNGGQSVSAPISGFIKQISVRSGEFVQAGQPLAVISKDQALQLKAEVPLRFASELPLISSASFKTVHNNKVYTLQELNGKLISYGKSVDNSRSLLPVFFSLSNDGSIIPGEVVEVFLQTKPIPNALAVPITSLIEEQGNFYVYVQLEGESFDKRSVKLGANDGKNVQVLLGIRPGERVVTKGAQMVKLATQSGSVPAHGHEH